MNQKKAKRIRKFVRDLPVPTETVYTDYKKVGFFFEEGKIQKIKGTPCVMESCQRSVVKGMK